MEKWEDIKGYEGLYQISNQGKVKSLRKWDVNNGFVDCERLLHPTNNGRGYLIIVLGKNKKRKNFYIHRLVATAFLDKPIDKNVVNHKDYNTMNNCV